MPRRATLSTRFPTRVRENARVTVCPTSHRSRQRRACSTSGSSGIVRAGEDSDTLRSVKPGHLLDHVPLLRVGHDREDGERQGGAADILGHRERRLAENLEDLPSEWAEEDREIEDRKPDLGEIDDDPSEL